MKYEFHYREKLELKSFFGTFGLSRIRCNGNKKLLDGYSFASAVFSIGLFVEEIEHVMAEV